MFSDDSLRYISTNMTNAESPVEVARLLNQHFLFTMCLGGLFPEHLSLTGVRDVLDVACGPGRWAGDVARLLPWANVVGVDISRAMIETARLYAQNAAHLNTTFLEMDVREGLHFPGASFHVVHAQLLNSFLFPSEWPTFLKRCLHVLTVGGCLLVTEWEKIGTTSQAVKHLLEWVCVALRRRGQCSTLPQSTLTPLLPNYLTDVGYSSVEQHLSALDCSYGTQAHPYFVEDVLFLFRALRGLLIATGVASAEEVDHLLLQAQTEVQLEDFRAWMYLSSVWGRKV